MDEVHAYVPAIGPKSKFLDIFQYHFQKELRNSQIWDEMVSKYGVEKSEELLEEIQFSAK